MIKIVRYIFIIFGLLTFLQLSSCDDKEEAELIYRFDKYSYSIVGISTDCEEIIIPKMHNGYYVYDIINNAFDKAKSLKKVYYEGTIDDWYNIKFSNQSSNPMYYAEEIYFLNEEGKYYLVDEIYFDTTNVNMDKFYGFDCLKTLKLSKNVKYIEIPLDYTFHNMETVYYEGTIDDWYNIKFSNQSSNPMYYAEEIYFLNEEGKYYLVDEIYFDTTNVNMDKFYGFDCLKTLKLSKNVKYIEIPLDYTFHNMETVYYEGTIDDWYNIYFDKNNYNPMYYAENIYVKNENGEYYLVEELKFDSLEINIANINGFDCLKRIYLSNEFKNIREDNLSSGMKLTLEDVYYEGTFNDWLELDFSNPTENPLIYADNLYLLNEQNEYYLVKEIIIPENITEIKANQFVGLDSLNKIVLGDHIEKYGSNIFLNNTNIEEVYITKNYDFSVNIFEKANINNLYFDGTLLEWFDLEIEFNPMSISEKAYYKNETGEYVLLKDLVIPSSIKILNGNHINGYIGLESLYIPDTIEFIDPSILKDCINIKKIEVSLDNKIYDSRENFNGIIETQNNKIIFGGNSKKIPNTIEEIGEYSFIGCDEKVLSISQNIKVLPNNLYRDDQIEVIYYKGTMEEWFELSTNHFLMNIDNAKLYLLNEKDECYKVKEVVVPRNTKFIGKAYFSGIKQNLNIYLPNDLEEMYADAFYDCEGIKVYYPGTYEDFCKIKFNEVTYHIGIYWNIYQPLIYDGEFLVFDDDGEYITYYKK